MNETTHVPGLCFNNLFPVKEGLICFTPNIRDTDKLVKIRYTSNQPCPEKETFIIYMEITTKWACHKI